MRRKTAAASTASSFPPPPPPIHAARTSWERRRRTVLKSRRNIKQVVSNFFSSQFAYLAVLEELRFADALAEEGEGTLALDEEDVDDVIVAPAGDSLAEAEAVAELSLASNLLSSS